jgi:hypothetical protein
VDIRRFIPEIQKDHMFAFAPIAELAITADASVNFWTKTRMLRNDLTARIDGMNAHEMLFMSEHFHSFARQLLRFMKATDGTHDVTLSNMGRLDIPENYQSFQLDAIFSPSACFPWKNPNTLIVSSFRNYTDFAFVSNENFLPQQQATVIMDKMQELLIEKQAVLQEL